MAAYIHWLLCGKYGMQQELYWWMHKPVSVIENDSALRFCGILIFLRIM